MHKGYNEIVKTCTLLEYKEEKINSISVWVEVWMDEQEGVLYRAHFPERYANLPMTYYTQYA